MPNCLASRTVPLWPLAAEPPERHTSAPSHTARKWNPLITPPGPPASTFPGVLFGGRFPCIMFDPHRLAQAATGGDPGGAALRHSMLATPRAERRCRAGHDP